MENTSIESSELTHILTLRLLIARAGQKDSLQWWNDDSLTASGAYLLERLFPFAPQIQGRKLSLIAVKTRHEAVFRNSPSSKHLFHLSKDGEIEYLINRIPLNEISLLDEPIDTIEQLKTRLTALIEVQPQNINVKTTLPDSRIPVVAPKNFSIIQLVNSLAWTYLQGEKEQPVFPFVEG